MKLISDAESLKPFANGVLVPTMGALHAGHAELFKQARAIGSPVVVSIFVNPKQFAANEDLDRYPRTLDADLQLCAMLEVDAVFAPSVDVIYPSTQIVEEIDPGPMGETLEGEFRSTHFKGVLTVVNRLFNLTKPSRAIFGKKDRQQLVLIKQMAKRMKLPIDIIDGETVRDGDGLALSSRNRFLSDSARRDALALPRSLKAAVHGAAKGMSAREILDAATTELAKYPTVETDYCTVTDLDLQPVDEFQQGPAIILGAIRVDGVRLIDNMDLVLR